MTFRLAVALSLLLPLVPALGAQEPVRFKVIVNAENPVEELRREELGVLFLNTLARWRDGRPCTPVDQSMNSPVRVAFSSNVLGRSTLSVQHYWQQRMLSHREMPPRVKTSDVQVIAHVSKERGGIGYVSEGAALPDTVKILRVLP